jgi:hypothetical protein
MFFFNRFFIEVTWAARIGLSPSLCAVCITKELIVAAGIPGPQCDRDCECRVRSVAPQ